MLGNNKELAFIPVAKWKFDTLTAEEAFDLATHDNIIQGTNTKIVNLPKKWFKIYISYKIK